MTWPKAAKKGIIRPQYWHDMLLQGMHGLHCICPNGHKQGHGLMAMGAPHHRDSDLHSFFWTGAVTLAITVNTFTHMRMSVSVGILWDRRFIPRLRISRCVLQMRTRVHVRLLCNRKNKTHTTLICFILLWFDVYMAISVASLTPPYLT